MKRFILLAVTACFFLLTAIAYADPLRENPSVYSFAEIVQKLPKMWTSSFDEVTEMMKQYPDLVCRRSYDIISCTSVNNKYSAEINVNLQFTSEKDDAEFVQTVFTYMIDSTEEVQKILELFWLPEMKAANISGTHDPADRITLYFSTDNTMETYSIYFNEKDTVWLVIVSFGIIRG
ncbi:MAG: hypothetical protein IJI07_09390 [Flexilinea sp.]|nr:hypothetical protein [Flexilinea sp.]